MALSRITANSIEDGTIVAADIADGSITTAKIADANVTAGKIVSVANTQITGNITSSQIVPDPVFNGNTTVTNIITGAGTVGAPSIAPTGDLNTGIYFPAADNIGFATNGVIRGRWTTDGLCFGSDTAAANALDDYEEGTFTPAFQNIGTGTYGTTEGTYLKIGNTVIVTIFITMSSLGTASGDLIITGLPFTKGARVSGLPQMWTNNWTANAQNVSGVLQSTTIDLYRINASSAVTTVTHADMGAGSSNLLVSFSYFV